MLGEKDIGEEAQSEMRLNTIEGSVPSAFNHINSSQFIFFSAREATRRQLVIDVLDVWIPATGAELVSVNEGMLGILGFVTLFIVLRCGC
jgi:peroxin-11B